jgi:hypothetical protein
MHVHFRPFSSWSNCCKRIFENVKVLVLFLFSYQYATTIYCSMSSDSLLLLLDDLLRTRFGTLRFIPKGSQSQGIMFARGRSRGGGSARRRLTTRLATRRSFSHESRAKLGVLYDFLTPPPPLLSFVTVL